jgi:hypothetical protein
MRTRVKYLPPWKPRSFFLPKLRQENGQANTGELPRILIPRTSVNSNLLHFLGTYTRALLLK